MIMETALIALALNCPATVVKKPEGTKWEQADKASLKSAATRCAFHFPEAPCLKVFEKREPLTYRATCGEK